VRSDANQRALEAEKKQTDELQKINDELLASRDSITRLAASLQETTYNYHRNRAKDLFEQREYADARESFQQAINYLPKDRQQELPGLKKSLSESLSFQIQKAKFDTLMNQGDRSREQFMWKEAYAKYDEAKKLNYDNDAVKVKILLCRRELEQEAALHLRRALTFLTKGNDAALARLTIEEHVDPIRNLLIFWDASLDKEYEIISGKIKTIK
jgi:tetratricopeptide (TPR) repeat protein